MLDGVYRRGIGDMGSMTNRPAPPDDLVKLVAKWRKEADEYPVLHEVGAAYAASAVRLCANELERALAAPAPVAADDSHHYNDDGTMTEPLHAPVAAPAPVALAHWLRRTKPQPDEWRSRDGELPQMGGGTAGYLDALQAWNEAREAVGLAHGFEANIDAFLLQNVAAPAPETPACLVKTQVLGAGSPGGAFHVSIGGTGEARSETPAPDAMPEKCANGHEWSNQFGEDWTPDEGTPCDCGAKRWRQEAQP